MARQYDDADDDQEREQYTKGQGVDHEADLADKFDQQLDSMYGQDQA